MLLPTMVVGALIVVALQFWDMTIDSDALRATGPIRMGFLLHLAVCIAATMYAPTHATRRNWLFFCLYLYIGSGIGLSAALA